MPIKIRPESECKYDALSLGESMVRLSPEGHGRIEFAPLFECHVGGGEYNVAYALARLGCKTGFISKLPDNPIARIVLNHGRAVGMDMSHVVMEDFDGVGRSGRVGLNFTEVGAGPRASVTLYDRGHSCASQMKPEDVDWKEIFEVQGARWLHTGGIFSALSSSCAESVKEALKTAAAAGTICSYDLNFRSKLWTSEEAIRVTKDIVPHVQALIGNEEDFQKVLGFEVEGVDENLSSLPIDQYKRMVEKVVETYPNIKAVCTTLREVKSAQINSWGGILWYDGQFYESIRFEELEIEDRVGGGDGFSSGIAYGFINGLSPQEIVDFGAAHGALLQSTRGDTSQLTLSEVKHVMKGGSARIIR